MLGLCPKNRIADTLKKHSDVTLGAFHFFIHFFKSPADARLKLFEPFLIHVSELLFLLSSRLHGQCCKKTFYPAVNCFALTSSAVFFLHFSEDFFNKKIAERRRVNAEVFAFIRQHMHALLIKVNQCQRLIRHCF